MTKFNSKLVTIEAEQFIPEKKPWPDGVQAGGMEGKNDKPTHYIETRSGTAAVVSGDWIIREPDGKGAYPCCDAVFNQKYETGPKLKVAHDEEVQAPEKKKKDRR